MRKISIEIAKANENPDLMSSMKTIKALNRVNEDI